jgi:hypothetical protein
MVLLSIPIPTPTPIGQAERPGAQARRVSTHLGSSDHCLPAVGSSGLFGDPRGSASPDGVGIAIGIGIDSCRGMLSLEGRPVYVKALTAETRVVALDSDTDSDPDSDRSRRTIVELNRCAVGVSREAEC